MGLHRAGFEVVGVDIRPQPNYPFEFHQADALTFPLEGFDFIWASPPCQAYSQMSVRYEGKGGTRDAHPELIGPIRQRLEASGSVYVIENVNGARNHLRSPFRLTGEMFGLGVHRPRWFEPSFGILAPKAPPKQPNPVAVYGAKMDGRRLWTRVDGSELRAPRSIEAPAAAMGIDWMLWDELREAIPPAYAEFIGRAAIAHIEAQRDGSMNAILSFVGPTYDQILSALRLNSVPVQQPRDDAGKFVSKRDLRRAELVELVSTLSVEAKSAAKLRATQRGRG